MNQNQMFLEPGSTPETKDEGWTFVVDKISVQATKASIFGYFLFFRLQTYKEPGQPTDQPEQENLSAYYLTDPKNPIELKIPPELMNREAGAVNYELSTKEVYEILNEVFSKGYGDIPKPNIELPLHKVPPSRREELLEMVQKGEL